MYNGQQIRILLAAQDKKPCDLALAIYGNNRRDIAPLCNGNPSVETLEKVADFFQVPLDIFFKRGVTVNTETSGDVPTNVYVDLLIAAKEEIIQKQEEQIKLLRAEIRSLKRKKSEKNDGKK